MNRRLIEFLFLMFILVISSCQEEESEFVEFQNDRFLNALIEYGVDTNGDGYISKAEAEAVSELRLNKHFYDMKGIEAFINLTRLFCSTSKLDVSKNTLLELLICPGGGLTNLDVSKNTALLTLECDNNKLTELDVSNNPFLWNLTCNGNEISSLDIYPNTDLYVLNCSDNRLTDLDISKNTELRYLICGYNNITSLNISGNSNLVELKIDHMSTLYKVCVWTMPFPPDGVTIDTTGSPNVYFTMDCTKEGCHRVDAFKL